MKKVVLAIAAVAMVAFGVCAQSADEKDVAKLTAKLAEVKASDWWQSGDIQVKIALAKIGEPATFADFVNAVKAGAEEVKNFPTPEAKQRFIDGQITGKARWWYKGTFVTDGFAHAKKTGVGINFYIVWYNPVLKLSDEELYTQTINIAFNENLSAVNALRCVSQIVKLGATKDEVTVKADLKKLNRLYSPKLIVDKAAWEPVVATIRTALETY